jgi:hypothetical protein
MDIIFSEVNFDPKNIYIIQCIGAFNEESFIEYNLKSIYNEVDKIIVVEGAVDNYKFASNNGRSTDLTLEKIRSFKDPDGKIELIIKDGPWKDLEEQKQVFLDRAEQIQKENPNLKIWMCITDCDEFYHPIDIRRYRKAIELKPYATEFIPTFLHFWRDFSHIRVPCEKWNILHQRVTKYQRGMRYLTHPIAYDEQGVDTCLSGQYQPFRFQIPNLFVYHYGNIKPIEFQQAKADFYQRELAKYGAAQEAQDKFKEFKYYTESKDELLLFDGEHPEVMKEHPLFNKEDPVISKWEVTNWKTNKFYSGIPLPLIFTQQYQRDIDLWHTNPLEV